MSAAQFYFTDQYDATRGRGITEKFLELASVTHTTALTADRRNSRYPEYIVRLCPHGEDGRPQFPPEGGYRRLLFRGIQYDYYDSRVDFAIEEGADVAATLHPLVDILIQVFCHFRIEFIAFGDHSPVVFGEDRVWNTICSNTTLHRLFTSNIGATSLVVGRLRIGERFIQAFACSENKANNLVHIRFCNTRIENPSMLGKCLRNNPGVRGLKFEYLPSETVVPILENLRGHPTIECLSLFEVCGQSLTTQDQSVALWNAIKGIKLFKLTVEQENDDAIRPYANVGLWRMLSEHESIRAVHFGHHKPIWTKDVIKLVADALQENSNIVSIGHGGYSLRRDLREGGLEGQWNETVVPRVKKNQLQARIDNLVSQEHPRSAEEWFEILKDEADDVAGLYQFLRETVDTSGTFSWCKVYSSDNKSLKRKRSS